MTEDKLEELKLAFKPKMQLNPHGLKAANDGEMHDEVTEECGQGGAVEGGEEECELVPDTAVTSVISKVKSPRVNTEGTSSEGSKKRKLTKDGGQGMKKKKHFKGAGSNKG